MPWFKVELVRLRPEYLTLEIGAQDAQAAIEKVRAREEEWNQREGWQAGTEATTKYATVRQDDDTYFINFRD